MPFSIIIDGPNFISRLKQKKGQDYVLNTFDFGKFHHYIQKRLTEMHLNSHPFVHTYFICSDGGSIGTIDESRRDELLRKIGHSRGVSVLEVKQHTSKTRGEKGVDMTVLTKAIDCFNSSDNHEIVIITQDSDFVPAIKCLTQLNAHVIVCGFFHKNSNTDEQLINVSYDHIDLQKIITQMDKNPDKY
ncbi:MAG: NYN domain-containing protein [Thermoplasmatota archaeon]